MKTTRKVPGDERSSSPILTVAALVYALLAGAAFLWGYLDDRPNLFVVGPSSTPMTWLLGSAGGLACGLWVVALSRLAERTSWGSRLISYFASVLGPLGWLESAVLALLSSLAEELFFRGAMQPVWGIWLSSLLFMAAHIAPKRGLWVWTVMTGVMGLLFGYGAEISGNLGFPIAAHFIINLLNLHRIGTKAEARAGHEGK